MQAADGGPAGELLDGLFGPRRRLYKRWLQFSLFQNPDLYHRLTRRPYPWLVACAEEVAHELSHHLGRRVAPCEILIDSPPVKLEVQFNVDIYYPKEDCYRPLGDVSPVVQTLAQQQFDDYVKSVRVFVTQDLLPEFSGLENADEILNLAIDRTE